VAMWWRVEPLRADGNDLPLLARDRQFPALPGCCHSSNEAFRPRSAYWRARVLTQSALPVGWATRKSHRRRPIPRAKTPWGCVRSTRTPRATP